MGCNGDYLRATNTEREMSRVYCLLDELEGKSWDKSSWDGYHPKVYNLADASLDEIVSKLCRKLQSVDVSKHSLELQIWWRDHKEADKIRIEQKVESDKILEEINAALLKLTPREREILGLPIDGE